MGEGFKIQHQLPVFDTDGYLYKDGDEKTALTGGWNGNFIYYPQYYVHSLLSLETASMNGYVTGSFKVPYRSPTNGIDLTDYSSLKMLCDCTIDCTTSSLDSHVRISTFTSRSTNSRNADIFRTTSGTNVILALNIASLNGVHFIAVYGLLGGESGTVSLTVKRVWLEV